MSEQIKTVAEIAKALNGETETWDESARLLGNVTAGEIVRLCRWCLAAQAATPTAPGDGADVDVVRQALEVVTADRDAMAEDRDAWRLLADTREVRIAEARVLAAAILKMTEGAGDE